MAAPEAMTYISPAHEAMKPFAERPAKDEKQEHGAMVGIPADVLNTRSLEDIRGWLGRRSA